MKPKVYDHIIIGAGASGLMFASLLDNKKGTLLIDSNRSVGAKISISGGGKCNITNVNVGSINYLGTGWFVDSVLARLDQEALLEWLDCRGLKPHLRDGGEYFCKNSSSEILSIFEKEIKGVEIFLGTKVTGVSKTDDLFRIDTNRGNFKAKHLIVASGGLSFSKLGASGIGYEIAEQFGHTVTPLSPALVGLTVQKEQFFFKELSGISVPVRVAVKDRIIDGELLFAHRGISGPAALNTSLYWHRGQIEIDFLPKYDLNLLRGKKQISTLLPLPKRVAKSFLCHLGVSDKPADSLTIEERSRLEQLKRYIFAPAGTFGYSRAEVTKGGVSTDEIDPYSMMSLKEPNLYFIGEVLDVTGELGGYNFQWAFSSAFACAETLDRVS